MNDQGDSQNPNNPFSSTPVTSGVDQTNASASVSQNTPPAETVSVTSPVAAPAPSFQGDTDILSGITPKEEHPMPIPTPPAPQAVPAPAPSLPIQPTFSTPPSSTTDPLKSTSNSTAFIPPAPVNPESPEPVVAAQDAHPASVSQSAATPPPLGEDKTQV